MLSSPKVMRTIALALLTVVMSVAVDAQWVRYPTRGAPRLPDGSVNVKAPAPKTPDGRPDFSGLWTGAGSIPDPACVAKPGCIGQEPIPIQALHIGFTTPAQMQRVRSGQDASQLLPYQG